MRTRQIAALIAVLALLAFLAWRAGPGTSVAADIAYGAGAAVVIALLAGRVLARRGRRDAPPGPTAEQEATASRALAETDNSVRTSEQELGFALARYGMHAAAPFSEALTSAKAELAAAFGLRQLLDERGRPEAERRSMLAEIGSRCAEADRLLNEQAEAFERLQNLQARAPEVVAEVDAHADQQASRLGNSVRMLDHLSARYTPQAVASVAANPRQAAERLETASDSLAKAQQALAHDDNDQAAVWLEAAESAADQASDLLDAIRHLDAELTQSSSALAAALREIDQDITEAAGLVQDRPGDERALVVTTARAAAARVRRQLQTGPFDALAALRALEEANTALARVLAAERERRTRQDRASAVLDQAMLVARSSLTSAEDFVNARRGAIRAPARTRLAEAHRHFEHAISCIPADPETALNDAQQADTLAQQARSLADRDVARPGHGEARLPARSGGFGLLTGSGDAGLTDGHEIAGSAPAAGTDAPAAGTDADADPATDGDRPMAGDTGSASRDESCPAYPPASA